MPVVRSIRDGCTDFTSVTGKRRARGTERENEGQERENGHHRGTLSRCCNVAFSLKGLNLGLNPSRAAPTCSRLTA